MNRKPPFYRSLASLPLRWRLALVSFGLLALLLIALGVLISATEEQTLLASQASVLSNEEHIAQMQLQASKTQLTSQQILTFPTMSKELSFGLVDSIHTTLGQDVGVSLLSFDGSVLATDSGRVSDSQESAMPVVTLAPSRVRHWLTASSTTPYLLATDKQGQRDLVLLLPMAAWDKSIQPLGNIDTREDVSGYRKALLQLSMPTTAIDQTVEITRLILIFGILVALGIAAAFTLPLINIALRPLVEMEKVSSRIAAGALELRLVEPSTNDEIGRLTRAFNEMVAHLEATFTRQKRFVADVSHELRTPLTGLGGSLEMLLLGADDGDEETTRRLTSGMYAEVERMQRLVADLLALTRLDEGHLRLHREAVEVLPLVNEICEHAQEMMHGQKLQCQVPSALPLLYGDVDQLRRILLNIVENALKFTPSDGRIELVASNEGQEWITLEVQDSGIGIPPEALPHVFERFYRADFSRTRLPSQIGGSGLGLAIAQELVKAHNGTITISSTPGQGTTVTIRLPAQPPAQGINVEESG